MLIPSNEKISECIFIDIETVAKTPLDKDLEIFMKYYASEQESSLPPLEQFLRNAALHPELGVICCISVGYVTGNVCTTKAFVGNQEIDIIRDSLDAIHQMSKGRSKIVAHNLKGFDLPFILKRSSILNLSIPPCMRIYGKKPWEMTNLIDTLEIWKCGSYSGKGSMAALCNAYGIPTPKDDIDGSMIGEVFLNKEFGRIATYCNKDVLALARLFTKMNEETNELEHKSSESSIYNKLL